MTKRTLEVPNMTTLTKGKTRWISLGVTPTAFIEQIDSLEVCTISSFVNVFCWSASLPTLCLIVRSRTAWNESTFPVVTEDYCSRVTLL